MHAVSQLRIEQILNPKGLDWERTEVKVAGVKRFTIAQITQPRASAPSKAPLVVSKQFTLEQIVSPRGSVLASEAPRAGAATHFTIEQIILPKGPAVSSRESLAASPIAEIAPETVSEAATAE